MRKYRSFALLVVGEGGCVFVSLFIWWCMEQILSFKNSRYFIKGFQKPRRNFWVGLHTLSPFEKWQQNLWGLSFLRNMVFSLLFNRQVQAQASYYVQWQVVFEFVFLALLKSVCLEVE